MGIHFYTFYIPHCLSLDISTQTRRRKGQETGEDCIMRSLITALLTKYYWGDQIKEDDLSRACSTHGRVEKCVQYLGWKI
jgi:hypothetical protein